MKTWGLRASCVAAGVLCVLAWSTVWAQAPAPSADLETLKRMMQEIISENQELKARVRKLEDAIGKQDRPAVPLAQQPAGEPINAAAKEPEKDVKALEERVAQLETENPRTKMPSVLSCDRPFRRWGRRLTICDVRRLDGGPCGVEAELLDTTLLRGCAQLESGRFRIRDQGQRLGQGKSDAPVQSRDRRDLSHDVGLLGRGGSGYG